MGSNIDTKPSRLGSTCRIFVRYVLPVAILIPAIFLGWLIQQPFPEGTMFATIFPLMKGKLPPTIVGHGHMTGSTPVVPEDMKAEPRPEGEMFLALPGGYQMPQNGLGMCCRPAAYDHVLVKRQILWYLQLGGRLIDGAHVYLNHKAIGEGIKAAMERYNIAREDIFITTKVFPRHYGYNLTKTTVPTYLEELGVDYIDLVLMHFPVTFPLQNSGCHQKGLSGEDCRAETWKALSELRESGIVRNVGVSNFNIRHIKELQEMEGSAPVAVHQMQFNPWAPQSYVDIFEYCHAQNISVTAYGSLAGFMQHSQASTVEALQELSTRYKKSIPQIMLRWAIQLNTAVIPGTSNPKHMRENLEVYSFELSSKDMETLEELRSDETAKQFFYMDPIE